MRMIVVLCVALAASSAWAQTPRVAPQIQPQIESSTAAANLTPEQLAQRVMFQSAQSADGDLRDMLTAIHDANARKQAMREHMTSLRRQQSQMRTPSTTTTAIAPASACRSATSAAWRACLDQVSLKLARVPQSDRAALDQEIANLRDEMERQREMSTDDLDLQAYETRMSRMMAMLSDLMRRMNETQNAITQNMK